MVTDRAIYERLELLREEIAGERAVIGASVRRVEDRRFLEGGGRFVADLSLPGELHCALVRSPHPHARIRSIAFPAGVLGFTGKDMAADGVGPMRAGWVLPGMAEVPRWALARDTCGTSASRSLPSSLKQRAAPKTLAEQVDHRHTSRLRF